MRECYRPRPEGCWSDCPKVNCTGELFDTCRSELFPFEMPAPNELACAIRDLRFGKSEYDSEFIEYSKKRMAEYRKHRKSVFSHTDFSYPQFWEGLVKRRGSQHKWAMEKIWEDLDGKFRREYYPGKNLIQIGGSFAMYDPDLLQRILLEQCPDVIISTEKLAGAYQAWLKQNDIEDMRYSLQARRRWSPETTPAFDELKMAVNAAIKSKFKVQLRESLAKEPDDVFDTRWLLITKSFRVSLSIITLWLLSNFYMDSDEWSLRLSSLDEAVDDDEKLLALKGLLKKGMFRRNWD